MPKRKSQTAGYSYRFDFGSVTSAVDVMCSVTVPGPVNKAKAVDKARKVLKEKLGEDGCDFDRLEEGRVYIHPTRVTEDNIVDVYPAY